MVHGVMNSTKKPLLGRCTKCPKPMNEKRPEPSISRRLRPYLFDALVSVHIIDAETKKSRKHTFSGLFLGCVAPNGVQRRVFALNGVRGDSTNVFPMIPMRGACPSCTTSLYLPDVFCSNRFCGFFESLEVLACFNLKHKARSCFPRGTKGAFPISFYLVSDIGIVSIFARRAQEPDFFIIPL